MNPKRIFSTVSLAALIFGATLLTGCQTPNLKPFSDSTAKIQDSIVAARDLYSGELECLRPYVPESRALGVQEKAFAENWQARVEVMEALVNYAGSLAAVADAPAKARAGLEPVVKSLKALATAAGPYQQAVEGGSEIGGVLADLATRARAASQLKQAVLAADPDLQKLAGLLARDFAALRHTLEENQKSLPALMDGKFSRQLDVRNAIAGKMEERVRDLQGHLDDPQWIAAVASFNQELAEPRKYLAEADKWYLPHQAALAAAQKEMAARIKLFRDTEAALSQWGKTHAALARDLQNGLAPDWTLLQQSADRVARRIHQIVDQNNQP